VTASAPVRICDCGGWTDTWFARHGAVFHIAIEPRVFVRATAHPRVPGTPTVTVHAENFGDRFSFDPGRRPRGAHPLLEAAVESVGVPEGCALEIVMHSEMPPGASTGTSGAVCVAVVGALRHLAGGAIDPAAVATAAHRVETDLLGQQSGVQDQHAAAFGGINYIEIAGYPTARVTPLMAPDAWLRELEARLVLVYLGRNHSSSAVHEAVIRDATGIGPSHPALEAMRHAAAAARDAVLAVDLAALGAAMRGNTDAQRRLHPALVGGDAERVIGLAREHGALGWKVNGAGGEGGSVTVLLGDAADARARLEAAIRSASHAFQVIPIRLARQGLVIGRQ
jgi:D-glycero-alpha-D-manno-heptose-7-phosphate kinase